MDVKTLTNDLITDVIVPASSGAVDTVVEITDGFDVDAVADTLGEAVDVVTHVGASGVGRCTSFVRSHPRITIAGLVAIAGAGVAVYVRRRRRADETTPRQLEPIANAA